MILTMQNNPCVFRAAIIDIGSNSIRYLDATLDAGRVFVNEKLRITTRLASGLDIDGRLSASSMTNTLQAIAQFASRAHEAKIPVFAYATSAMRDAKNGCCFASHITSETNVPVEMLSGEREAQLALNGACGTEGAETESYLIDIGGGSCQLTGSGFALSAPLGCIRAKELIGEFSSRPFQERAQIVRTRLDALMRWPRIRMDTCFGVGGTITTLAAHILGSSEYEPERLKALTLGQEDVQNELMALDALTPQARKQEPLLSERYDVIIPGGLILLAIMQRMGISALRPTDADGMEGYFLHIAQMINT